MTYIADGDDFAIDADGDDFAIDDISLSPPCIEKEKTSGANDIGIYLPDPCEYVFVITYSGPAALIIDTVPAEFEITSAVSSAGSVSYERANKKGGPKAKSATIITWDVLAGSSTLTVTTETRESPGEGHKKKGDPAPLVHKPTSCGKLLLNDGAMAYQVDEFGDPILDMFGEMIPIVGLEGGSGPLDVNAVCGAKPCTPENLVVTPVSHVTLSLNWDDVCGGVDVVYNIYRGGELIAEDVGVSNYDDTGLNPSTEYCYEVEAKYSGGPYVGNESGKSEEDCGTTLPPP
jgi:hypothetical protein